MSSWFDVARFGMFVHWGHSSQRGCELSWPLVGGNPALPMCGNIPVEEYHSTAATFDPQGFDASELARLAKRAGMEYAVLTAKHHDGYAMFHTRLSEFSVEHSPCRRDIVQEFVEAVRTEGLRVGLYFSLSDWHHPDYPPFTEADKPYTAMRWPRPSPEQWERYIEFMHGQVRELLTNYGRIDLLWFDGGWERQPEQWRGKELVEMIRAVQPEIVINDRLPGFGDYETPEQFVPAQPPERPWEVCLTMNESWGYNPADGHYKSSLEVVQTLCEITGRGGRLLLNVSPMGDGRLPPEQTERLDDVTRWMAANGEAIAGTAPGLEAWQFYGPSTRKGDTVYLHLLMRPYGPVTVRGIRIKRVRSVRVLASGREVPFRTRCAILDQMMNSDPLGELVIDVPTEEVVSPAAVLAVTFDTPG